MPEHPISLNLATIVHRVMTSPRGWRVSQLRDELGIAQRTYRKYRQTLHDDFRPWRRRDGTSALVEVEDGEARYLRLRPPRALGASDPDLECMAAAIHFARSLLSGMDSGPLSHAAELLMSDFRASIRDRDFILNGLLADADRMFVAEGPEVAVSDVIVSGLIRAIANRRFVTVGIGEATTKAAPLTLALRHSGLFCALRIDGEVVEVPVSDITSLELLPEAFDYPPSTQYAP